jgi:hypothetical protein
MKKAWRCPTLTGGDPQLPSALKSLTSVFGMGTGVTSSPSSPDNLVTKDIILCIENKSRDILKMFSQN